MHILPISGIYGIVNKISSDTYIGSSSDILRRISSHKSVLNCNRSKNYRLQNDWNKYGYENFTFTVLEIVWNKRIRIEKEGLYISSYNTSYNIVVNTGKEIVNYQHSYIFYSQWLLEDIRSFSTCLIRDILNNSFTNKSLLSLIKNSNKPNESYQYFLNNIFCNMSS